MARVEKCTKLRETQFLHDLSDTLTTSTYIIPKVLVVFFEGLQLGACCFGTLSYESIAWSFGLHPLPIKG